MLPLLSKFSMANTARVRFYVQWGKPRPAKVRCLLKSQASKSQENSVPEGFACKVHALSTPIAMLWALRSAHKDADFVMVCIRVNYGTHIGQDTLVLFVPLPLCPYSRCFFNRSARAGLFSDFCWERACYL